MLNNKIIPKNNRKIPKNNRKIIENKYRKYQKIIEK